MIERQRPAETSLGAVLRQAATRIDRTDAEWLLLHVLKRDRAWLVAHSDERMDAQTMAEFVALVARRAVSEPIAYLTGQRGFWSLPLVVDPGVLIPRPETELLVELALPHIAQAAVAGGAWMRIADLGTGSGAIALAIARERPQIHVVAVDISDAALAVAARNAAALGIGNVTFRRGDWCAPLLGERFALIVSNPPYIAADDPHLKQGDLRFEPALALVAGNDGLDAIRQIAVEAPRHLLPGGWLLLEHGWQQAAAVRALLENAGLVDCITACDLEQRDRVTAARLPEIGFTDAINCQDHVSGTAYAQALSGDRTLRHQHLAGRRASRAVLRAMRQSGW